MIASRALRWIALFFGTTLAASAAANGPSLVVDLDSGKVVHQDRPTTPWYPASVTKLMTVYVALQAIREGKASLETVLTVSPEAAAMPPSKMGFRPGTEITLDNALKIIMVKSANDVSVTIAEGLAGSVEGFAERMNAASRGLGMKESRWVNPHGLPDDAQQTSARDMAILARALLRDFPEHRSLFQIEAIQFGRRIMANHNGLIGRYAGADGMKTGFICSSGFNVVATATRNGRRLITVVFGSRNAAERTLKAADLFDYGFAHGPGLLAPSVEQLPPAASLTPVNLRPYICGGAGPMPGESDAVESPIEANAGGNPVAGLFTPPNALAFAGGSVGQKRALGPRAKLTPVQVWTGRTPPAPGAVADVPAAPTKKGRRAAKKAAPKAPKQAAVGKADLKKSPSILEEKKPAAKAAPKAKPAAKKPPASPAKKPAKAAQAK